MNKDLGIKIGTGPIMLMILFIVLLLSIAFRDTFFEYLIPESPELTESQQASQKIAQAILNLEKVTLDTTILKSPYFENVTTLPSYPTDAKTLANFGKTNPFLGGFVVVPTETASSTVGGRERFERV
jgi:hypothetical protein